MNTKTSDIYCSWLTKLCAVKMSEEQLDVLKIVNSRQTPLRMAQDVPKLMYENESVVPLLDLNKIH
jgi:hypothetical protein